MALPLSLRAPPWQRVAIFSIAILFTSAGAVRPASDAESEVRLAVDVNKTASNTSAQMSGELMYMAAARPIWWAVYKDGPLDSGWKDKVKDRITSLRDDADKFQFLLQVDEVWVAPSRAAIETALITLATAWKLNDDEQGSIASLPVIKVKGQMRPIGPYINGKREKYEFDRGGIEGEERKLAADLGTQLFNNDQRLKQLVDTWWTSYLDFAGNQYGAKCPTNAEEVFSHIHSVKHHLWTANQQLSSGAKKILLIADHEFGNYMFMPWLPYVSPRSSGAELALSVEVTPEELQSQLIRTSLASLKHCSIVKFMWKADAYEAGVSRLAVNAGFGAYTVPYFQKVVIPDAELEMGERELRSLPFDRSQFIALEAGESAPDGAVWKSWVMEKRKRLRRPSRWSGWKKRIIGISYFESSSGSKVAYINWAKIWGEKSMGSQLLRNLEVTRNDRIISIQALDLTRWQIRASVQSDALDLFRAVEAANAFLGPVPLQ